MKPNWRGSLCTVDLLVLTSLHQLFLILLIWFAFFTKQAALMRRSTVLSLPLRLVFPGSTHHLRCRNFFVQIKVKKKPKINYRSETKTQLLRKRAPDPMQNFLPRCQWQDSNPQFEDYELSVLPLSNLGTTGKSKLNVFKWCSHGIECRTYCRHGQQWQDEK